VGWRSNLQEEVQDAEQAKVLKETRRRQHWFTIRDLLADGRCRQAVLGFLSTTDVGRLVPADEDAVSEVSEWEYL